MTEDMEIVAHGLWAAAAAITAKRTSTARISIGWSVWWTAFPDVLAFGPLVAIGLWLRLVNGTSGGRACSTAHFHPLTVVSGRARA
jgi:hypothetical protein